MRNFFCVIFSWLLIALQKNISMSRQGIIFIPVLFILQAVIEMTGLVWPQLVADVLSILIAAILFGKTMKKMQLL